MERPETSEQQGESTAVDKQNPQSSRQTSLIKWGIKALILLTAFGVLEGYKKSKLDTFTEGFEESIPNADLETLLAKINERTERGFKDQSGNWKQEMEVVASLNLAPPYIGDTFECELDNEGAHMIDFYSIRQRFATNILISKEGSKLTIIIPERGVQDSITLSADCVSTYTRNDQNNAHWIYPEAIMIEAEIDESGKISHAERSGVIVSYNEKIMIVDGTKRQLDSKHFVGIEGFYENTKEQMAAIDRIMEAKEEKEKIADSATPSEESVNAMKKALATRRNEHYCDRNGCAAKPWIDETMKNELAEGFARLAKSAGVSDREMSKRLRIAQKRSRTRFIGYNTGEGKCGSGTVGRSRNGSGIIELEVATSTSPLFHEFIHLLGMQYWIGGIKHSLYEEGTTNILTQMGAKKGCIGYPDESLLVAALGEDIYMLPIKNPSRFLSLAKVKGGQKTKRRIKTALKDLAKKYKIPEGEQTQKLIDIYTKITASRDTDYTRVKQQQITVLKELIEENGTPWTVFLQEIEPPGTNFAETWLNRTSYYN